MENLGRGHMEITKEEADRLKESPGGITDWRREINIDGKTICGIRFRGKERKLLG
jgi:hypothetical protein